MTPAWTKATRPKCRFSKRLRQIRTPENFELKRQWRNETTKQRRITIRKYWSKLSDDLSQNRWNFTKPSNFSLTGRTREMVQEIIFRYLHSFLGDRSDYSQVLCNSLTYASIGCRKLFRSQCTLGFHMRGIGHRTHTERHAHCRSYKLQIAGNAH